MTKTCNNCHEEKPATAEYFYTQKQAAGGLRSWCKLCVKIKSAEFWKANPEKRRAKARRKWVRRGDELRAAQRSAYMVKKAEDPEGLKRAYRGYTIKSRYGITQEKYDALFQEQGGVCAICGLAETKRENLAVDHDHGTNAVRALLCVKCNAGLGQFKENIDLLAKAISYLQKHAEPKIEISFDTLTSRKEE